MATVHEAARRNDVEALRRLLDEDPGLVEAEDRYYNSRPLHLACEAGAKEAACLLLDQGAAIDARDNRGKTPLMRACEAGRAEVVSILLQHRADPVQTSDGFRFTALMWACFGGERHGSDHVAVIRLLLKDGRTPVDARGHRNGTALWWACHSGYTERARALLLEGRADYTIADTQRITPLGAAQLYRHHQCVQLLQWYEAELRAFPLSKAWAVVDATESISKAPEKVGAKTEAQAQRARKEAAPAWLRGRVERGEALPCVEVAGPWQTWSIEGQQLEDERWAVLEYVVTMLKEDLHTELMEGLRLR